MAIREKNRPRERVETSGNTNPERGRECDGMKCADTYRDRQSCRSASAATNQPAEKSAGQIPQLFFDANCRNTASRHDTHVDHAATLTTTPALIARGPGERPAQYARNTVVAKRSANLVYQRLKIINWNLAVDYPLENKARRSTDPGRRSRCLRWTIQPMSSLTDEKRIDSGFARYLLDLR